MKKIIYVFNKGSENRLNKDICLEILNIADEWYELSKITNPKGIELIGSKIVFEYNGIEYNMFVQSDYYEEMTYKKNIDYICDKLKKIGASKVVYRTGVPKF